MLAYDPATPQYPQTADWTCSACSLAWLNRALQIDNATDEWSAVDYIGNPENINATYGLMDGSGSVLAARLGEQGAPSVCLWPTWHQVLELARLMPLLAGGVAWNHWVGVRSTSGGVLYLANSAMGWCGIGDELVASDWTNLGPFAVVAVPLQRDLPLISA